MFDCATKHINFHIKTFWFGTGKLKQKITLMILFLLTKECIYIYNIYNIYIVYIIYIILYIYINIYNNNHTTSIRHQEVHLTYIENRPALA